MIDQTYDCEPTLTDQQVIEFCQKGFIILEAVVPDEINHRVSDFLDGHTHLEPVEILAEDWFVEGVLKNPQAAGAVRSLLGKNFKLPMIMSNHRVECPKTLSCGWHRDGGAIDATRLEFLQVFYYPQDTPKEMGPTELVPKLTLGPRQTPLHESLRQYPKGHENGGTGGLNFYHTLQHLAPRHLLHR